jgi:hypothetical protein
MQIRVKEDPKDFGKCGCGRSPSGYCIGWHGLTEDEWLEGKIQLIHNFNAGRVKPIDPQDVVWGDEDE